ncbi:MAG: hypothetical protein E7220_07415 [Clostridiales bacterium]|nr:hypothetical protein [Clostridiales bacterium]
MNIIHSFYSLANIFATVYYTDMKDTEIKAIIEDMKAAGCTGADTDRIMRMHDAGMDEEILVCLRKCRCSMIDELHERQRKIDHMDRLIRRTGRLTYRSDDQR